MRVLLHGVAHYLGHFDEAPSVFFLQRMKDTTLDWLETVGHIGNGPFANYIGGILQEVKVNQVGQWTVPFMDRETVVRSRRFIAITTAGGICFL